MTEEKVWELLILKLSGEATPEQLAELDLALQQYPEHSFQLGMIENAWKSRQQKELLNTADSYNRHLQRLSNHLADETLKYESAETVPIPAPKTKRLYRRLAIITAVAATGLFAFILVYNNSGSNRPTPVSAAVQNLVSTKNGSKTKIQLPDGTQVWLNSGSKISYGNDFTGSMRQVNLKGEAFFDVVKDPARPFIIHTDAIDITVLGTAFNVRSYPDEKVGER
jgi:transmembrane sensor